MSSPVTIDGEAFRAIQRALLGNVTPGFFKDRDSDDTIVVGHTPMAMFLWLRDNGYIEEPQAKPRRAVIPDSEDEVEDEVEGETAGVERAEEVTTTVGNVNRRKETEKRRRRADDLLARLEDVAGGDVPQPNQQIVDWVMAQPMWVGVGE